MLAAINFSAQGLHTATNISQRQTCDWLELTCHHTGQDSTRQSMSISTPIRHPFSSFSKVPSLSRTGSHDGLQSIARAWHRRFPCHITTFMHSTLSARALQALAKRGERPRRLSARPAHVVNIQRGSRDCRTMKPHGGAP